MQYRHTHLSSHRWMQCSLTRTTMFSSLCGVVGIVVDASCTTRPLRFRRKRCGLSQPFHTDQTHVRNLCNQVEQPQPEAFPLTHAHTFKGALDQASANSTRLCHRPIPCPLNLKHMI